MPLRIYGNMSNSDILDNFPHGVPIQVPWLVDKNGVQPVHSGALMQTNINVEALTVEAALTRKREYIYHAAMFDPRTAAELTLDEIWRWWMNSLPHMALGCRTIIHYGYS